MIDDCVVCDKYYGIIFFVRKNGEDYFISLLFLGYLFRNIYKQTIHNKLIKKMVPVIQLETSRRVLSLYRQLLRAGDKMPTPNRKRFIIQKTRTEFKANKHLTDGEEINFGIRLADTNLDTVLVQAEHLTRLMNDPNYHTDI